MMRQWMLCVIGLLLVGCAGTSQFSVLPTPLAVSPQPAATPATSVERVQTRFVSDESFHDFYWTPDSHNLIYAQTEKCSTGCKTTWYRFNVATGVTTTFEPEIVTIDPNVWKRLTDLDKYTPEISPQKSRSISPSGTWVIYSRVKPGYVGPTCQKGPCLPPIEVWAAKIDGSSSFMVADATKHGTSCSGMGWLDQERKALLECGYEGPVHFAVADLSERTLVDFNDIAKQSVITLHGADLSPDSSRLAVLNLLTKTVELEVFSVDGSAMVDIGPAAKAHWSADGQRLYYLQRVSSAKCAPAVIRAYDFSTRQDKVVLGPEVVLSPTQRVTLDACDHSFLISPAEDTVLFLLDDTGSWIVGLP